MSHHRLFLRLTVLFRFVLLLSLSNADDAVVSPSISHTPYSALVIIGCAVGAFAFSVILFVVCYWCFVHYNDFLNFFTVEDGENIENVVPGNRSDPAVVENRELNVSQISGLERGVLKFSIENLKSATNDFSNDNVLEGYGVMYKGILQDGRQVTVKKMQFGVKTMEDKIAHRNLADYIGYCISGDEHLLVYEYVPQKSLNERLLGVRKHEDEPLTWRQKFVIALDVAKAIWYLHELEGQTLIHGDLNSSNIILVNDDIDIDSDDVRAKVTGYCLVEPAPSIESATGQVTTKTDIFAYGVVLMELITGQQTLDENVSAERRDLVTWFRKCHKSAKDDVEALMDEFTNLDAVDQETLQSIRTVADVAYFCTTTEPAARPGMETVVRLLQPLVENFIPQHIKSLLMSQRLAKATLVKRLKNGWQVIILLRLVILEVLLSSCDITRNMVLL